MVAQDLTGRALDSWSRGAGSCTDAQASALLSAVFHGASSDSTSEELLAAQVALCLLLKAPKDENKVDEHAAAVKARLAAFAARISPADAASPALRRELLQLLASARQYILHGARRPAAKETVSAAFRDLALSAARASNDAPLRRPLTAAVTALLDAATPFPVTAAAAVEAVCALHAQLFSARAAPAAAAAGVGGPPATGADVALDLLLLHVLLLACRSELLDGSMTLPDGVARNLLDCCASALHDALPGLHESDAPAPGAAHGPSPALQAFVRSCYSVAALLARLRPPTPRDGAGAGCGEGVVSAVDSALDELDVCVTTGWSNDCDDALRDQALRNAAMLVYHASDLMVLAMPLNGADICARLRGQLMSVARLAASRAKWSAPPGARAVPPGIEDGADALQGGLEWAWDIRGAYDGPSEGEAPSRSLCRAIASCLATCCASWSPRVLHNPVGVIPTRTSGAVSLEQLACVLCLGRMAMLSGSADRHSADATAELIVNALLEMSNSLGSNPREALFGLDVLHCMLTTLAHVTPVLVRNGAEWVLGQVLRLLTRCYTDPTSRLGSMFLFRSLDSSKTTPVHGTLADCLEIIADGMASLRPALQQEYAQKMLALFCEVAQSGSIDIHARDIVALLPAIAAACEAAQAGADGDDAAGGSPSASRIWASSRSMSMGASEDTDAALDLHSVKLFRNLWLHCGMLGLGGHFWPQGWSRSEKWRAALGRVAAATPVLVYGTEKLKEEDVVQRVALELAPHLRAAGVHGTPTAVAARLKTLLPDGFQVNPASANNAFLLAIATLERCRAALGPLPLSRSEPLPLEMALAYLAGTPQASPELLLFRALVRVSFNEFVARLDAPRRPSSHDESPDRTIMRAEMLAAVLIATISSGGGQSGELALLADAMLNHLLHVCPALYYSPECFRVLLTQGTSIDHELPVNTRSWTQRWLSNAAQRAPSHVEHVFHHFISDDKGAAGDAARRRAAELATYIAAGRRRSALPQWSKLPGLSAVHIKSLSTGQVQGMSAMLSGGVEQLAADRLERALEGDRKPWTPDLDTLCLQAAAVVADATLRPEGTVPLRLLDLLCRAPQRHLSAAAMRTLTFAWAWVAASQPQLLDALVVQMLPAWQATVTQRRGLFAGPWTGRPPPLTPGDLKGWSADDEDEELISCIQAHHVWLVYLLELWESQRHRVLRADSPLAAVLHRVLVSALGTADALSDHPYARPALFRLLSLGLRYCRHMRRYQSTGGVESLEVVQRLQARVLLTAVSSFGGPVTLKLVPGTDNADEASHAMTAFLHDVRELHATGVLAANGPSSAQASAHLNLLLVLCQHDADMQAVMAEPLSAAAAAADGALHDPAGVMATAWAVSPAVAYALAARLTHVPALDRTLEHLVWTDADKPRVQAWARGAAYLVAAASRVSSGTDGLARVDKALASWRPMQLVDALQLLKGPWGDAKSVKGYCMRCLSLSTDEELAFWLPQMVQCLRTDSSKQLAEFLADAACDPARWLFLHRLVWALETEEMPSEEEFNPVIKRSGWQPPEDTGLWKVCGDFKQEVLTRLDSEAREYFEVEHSTFQQITNISGMLKPVPKEHRKDRIVAEARKIRVTRDDLYLPVDSHKRLIAVIPESGAPMQSAAKVPILVAFKVEVMPLDGHDVAPGSGPEEKAACIFKVGDDCRQDVLALQVITVLRNAFVSANLPLYLCPYGVVPTGFERGIVQVVPNAKSRAGLGELSDGGLYEIFQHRYGPPGTPAFEDARRNFLLSEAGYAVASYLLQSKDRHNGNILIDADGRIVHIDFGFILEISPGGNLGFETAGFKMSHEMVQLIDPSMERSSVHYLLFKEQCVRGFLAARTVANEVIAIVSLMADSRLPCYMRGKPLENLRARFHLEKTPEQAAAFMRDLVEDAYNKWTTGFYDYIQNLQQGIPM